MIRLLKTIRIATQPEELFRALTDPNRIPDYFPVDSVELEPAAGGLIEVRGSVGDQPFTDHGTVTCFEFPSRFAYRYWSTNHGADRTDENHMTIEYCIEPDGEAGSRLRLEHTNLLTDERFEQMDSAWDMLLQSLKSYLEHVE